MNLYSIYDHATSKFGTPWTAANDNAAKRAYERLAADASSDIHFRPKDYVLFALANFDENTGQLHEGLSDITPPLSS